MAIPTSLDDTLTALADPTRRTILARLARGEARVTELADPLPMSLNGVSKHIRVLERARLVRRRRAGREHFLSLDAQPLDEVAGWVFDAWLDVEKARKVLFATSTGQMVRAEIDPRVGGSFLFVDRRAGVDVQHIGEYLEIDRPRRLVFTFHTERGSTDLSRVTIDIVPLGGGCELTLTHEIDPRWADFKERTEAGWTTILDGFANVLN